jgi:hypothetical protein
LGNVETLPADDEIEAYAQSDEIKAILDATIGDVQTRETQLHLKAKELLEQERVKEAWMTLLVL